MISWIQTQEFVLLFWDDIVDEECRVLLRICLIFASFSLALLNENVAYKKKRVPFFENLPRTKEHVILFLKSKIFI